MSTITIPDADQKLRDGALSEVHELVLDQEAMRAHVMQPAHTQGVVSSVGPTADELRPHIIAKPAITHTFDVKGFGDALHASLKDSTAGYVMRLRQNGTTIYTLEWNWAKRPQDGGEGWKPEVRMHVASCSKLITAMAMTKLLNEKHISYDAHIIDHLPSYWAKGFSVDKITFRQLMTHTSGLNYGVKSSASDFVFMKSQIAAGVPNIGKYWYQNMNFGLCRILISTINGNVAVTAPLGDSNWDFVTIQAYVAYVQKYLFNPAGVSGPSPAHATADALAYPFPVNGGGWNSGDLQTVLGGAGWHISADELLSVMGTFRRKGTIMTDQQAQTMLDSGFGIDVIQSTALGKLYNKNGAWSNANPPGESEEQTLAYFLPQGMELVVMANSPLGLPEQFFRGVVTNIYLENIKP